MDHRPLPLIPPPGTISGSFAFRTARRVMGALMATYLPTTIVGREYIPASGGVIVAANHSSLLDVPLLSYAIGRESRFPAKPELFSHDLLARFLLSLGGFPIARGGGDRKALSFSERVIQEGCVLAIFPEGSRSRDGLLHPFHRGVALLAINGNVPIVPASITGSGESFPAGAVFPRPGRIVIRFGPPEWPEPAPLDPASRKAESLRLTERVHERVQSLLSLSGTH
ncbi:MAG: lysophospholipid acyltransferase family protein [Leptospirales bacterium]